MKKLALVIAIAMIAALYVTPVVASDFTAGGSYRAVFHNEDPGAGEKNQFIDQRVRLAFNWAVNDNVSAQLRGDFAEFAWGDGYRPEQGTDTLMVDRAWVKIIQGPMTLTVGQQYGEVGHATFWSDQFQGVVLDLDLKPATLKFVYAKRSEGGLLGNTLTDDDANDDIDFYVASVGFASDAFQGGISAGTRRDGATDDVLNGVSVHATVPLGMIQITGAVDYFDGDDGAVIEEDYAGLQAHVAFAATLSETLKAGITLLWAADVDADECQATALESDATFHPLDHGGALAYDDGWYGDSLNIFDFDGTGSGVLGVVLDAQFAANEAVTFYGKLGYAEPNDEDNLENKFYAVASVDYKWMPAVTISGGLAYVNPSYDNSATNDDPVVESLLRLGVSF